MVYVITVQWDGLRGLRGSRAVGNNTHRGMVSKRSATTQHRTQTKQGSNDMLLFHVVVVGSDHGKQRAATQDATRLNATQRRATGRERSTGDASNDDELGRQTCPLSLLWFRMSVHVFIAVP